MTSGSSPRMAAFDRFSWSGVASSEPITKTAQMREATTYRRYSTTERIARSDQTLAAEMRQ
jgi:hypothetical protein